ncbi:MAG: peptidoglycan bridge formation glycyltransferase FemA/FemB family protein [Gracilimonas sp.]|uniref:peptidoglycan bridge formation glycyltransferase FemA/FemB family protein n=1 Tax=Gracilimonas sp. TaxID=1974203 RepID=UPI0019AB26AC|nr:peptidoglycan bridge formation glycyltransferase FemA/FemB family protein [Gracilimonas sp.]MBD3614993.1 peptidoglycan bridge formation glycyltransferase FemA/FemB family protein [Gracilimonas sp.]
MKSNFLMPDDDQWNNILNRTNYEFYQHPEFLKLEAELVGGEATAWFAEDADEWILIPLIKRTIPDEITNGKEYYDLVSPYGYPGILHSSYSALNTFLGELKEKGKKAGYISTFIRLNPLLNPYFLHEDEDISHIIHGQVVMIDMNNSYDDLRMNYSSNYRRNLKKLVKSGNKLVWNEWELLDDFIEIYNETMERDEATEYYFFPKEYYLRIKDFIGTENIDLVIVRDKNQRSIAGAIFCKNDHVVQYHLGGTKNEFLNDSPSKMLFDGIIEKYSNEVEFFNLGGGVGNSQDSLFRFKQGFGKEYIKFSTLRIVNDRQRYNNLCADFSKEELYDMSGYFPLYRK